MKARRAAGKSTGGPHPYHQAAMPSPVRHPMNVFGAHGGRPSWERGITPRTPPARRRIPPPWTRPSQLRNDAMPPGTAFDGARNGPACHEPHGQPCVPQRTRGGASPAGSDATGLRPAYTLHRQPPVPRSCSCSFTRARSPRQAQPRTAGTRISRADTRVGTPNRTHSRPPPTATPRKPRARPPTAAGAPGRRRIRVTADPIHRPAGSPPPIAADYRLLTELQPTGFPFP